MTRLIALIVAIFALALVYAQCLKAITYQPGCWIEYEDGVSEYDHACNRGYDD